MYVYKAVFLLQHSNAKNPTAFYAYADEGKSFLISPVNAQKVAMFKFN